MNSTLRPSTDLLLGRRRLILVGGATAVLAACRRNGSGDAATTDGGTATSTAGDTAVATAVPSSPSEATTATTTTTAATTTTTATAATTETSAMTASSRATSLTAADFDGLGTCSLLPEKTAGPFPLDEQFDRRDITEGHEGHPVRLGLRVLDESCVPVPGAAVEIWHADATGDYSAFTDNGGGKDEGDGTTFLRGTQTAGDDGIVEFLTVYPGWYSGRAVHIHLRVHVDDETVLTSQLFFDDAYSASVLSAGAYADNGLPDTLNADDSIAGEVAAEGTMLVAVAGATSAGTGTLALLNLGIDPSARSADGAGGGPPRP